MGGCFSKKFIIEELTEEDELDFISVKKPLEDLERISVEFSYITTENENYNQELFSLSGRTTEDPLDEFINKMEKSEIEEENVDIVYKL